MFVFAQTDGRYVREHPCVGVDGLDVARLLLVLRHRATVLARVVRRAEAFVQAALKVAVERDDAILRIARQSTTGVEAGHVAVGVGKRRQ